MSNSQKEVLNSLHKQFSGEAAKKAGLQAAIIIFFEETYKGTSKRLRTLEETLKEASLCMGEIEHGLSEMHADMYHQVLWNLADELAKIANRIENDLSKKW